MRSAIDPAFDQLDDTLGVPSTDPFRGPPLDRRSMLLGTTAGAFLAPALLGEAAAQAATPPCPWSSIRLGRVDGTWLWKRGAGADQWPSSCLDRGKLLAAWGDGWGWNKGRTESKAFMGVTMISGSPTGPVGTDLWATTSLRIKPCAMLAGTGEPFMYVTSDRDDRDATYLMKGSNGGRSWSELYGPVVTKRAHGLQIVGAADRNPKVPTAEIVLYLAADGNRRTEELYDTRRNRTIWAAFTAREHIANPAGWYWYAGTSGAKRKVTGRAPLGSHRIAIARPHLHRPERVGQAFPGRFLVGAWPLCRGQVSPANRPRAVRFDDTVGPVADHVVWRSDHGG